jgi:hypothetical protein
MTYDVTIGTPVIEGSENWRADPPSMCEEASREYRFVLNANGLLAPPWTAPHAYFKSGARLEFANRSTREAELRWPRGISVLDGHDVLGWDLRPGEVATVVIIRYTVLMVNFTITCSDLGSGSTSSVACHICPTPIA